MHQTLQKVPGYSSFLWEDQSGGGEMPDRLQALLIKEGQGIKGRLSSRAIVHGGPLMAEMQDQDTERQQRFEGLIHTMIEALHKQCVYIQLRNFFDFDADEHAFLLQQGFRFQNEMNFVVPLESGRNPIKRFSASRRRQVRRGLESGARIEEAGSDEEVMAFYDILARIYRLRAKKPLAPPELFLHFARGPFMDGKGSLLLVKQQEKVIGGIMLLYDEPMNPKQPDSSSETSPPNDSSQNDSSSGASYRSDIPQADSSSETPSPGGCFRDTSPPGSSPPGGFSRGALSSGRHTSSGQGIYGRRAYEWYVCGMDQEYPRAYPSVLATWGGIHHAWKHGFDAFDFMGAGNPSVPYGVRDFKARFGGMATRHGRYLRINKPFIYQLGKAAVGLYSRLR